MDVRKERRKEGDVEGAVKDRKVLFFDMSLSFFFFSLASFRLARHTPFASLAHIAPIEHFCNVVNTCD